MKQVRKIIALLIAVCLVVGCSSQAFAASGTTEIFFFNYQGSVGEGGTAQIKSSLNSLGYTTNRYVNVHAYYVRRTMNEDKVFAIVSHGAPGRVVCKDGSTTMSASAVNSDNNNYSLAAWFNSGALSGMKFAYYGACQTARTSATYGNLLTYTTGTLGASCALGFYDSVSSAKATYYEGKLFQYLASGYTVARANNMAHVATYNAYGSYGAVDSAQITGNSNTRIN